MRKLTLRLSVATTTLTVSLLLAGFVSHVRNYRKADPTKPAIAASSPSPTPAVEFIPNEEVIDFPETTELTPRNIASFIDENSYVNLEPLWKRLHIRNGDELDFRNFSTCGQCFTASNEYDLDEEPGKETVLKISYGFAEAYRYLVFKYLPPTDKWKLLGFADAWGKYRESESMVVVSDGHAWLLVDGQSASGSGVAFYSNQLFQVTSKGMTRVLTYVSEGYQGGEGDWPSKEFSSRILDCKADQNKIEIKIEYQISYYFWLDTRKDEPLFSKRQVATFIKSTNRDPSVASNSSVSRRELDHIYNIDSMTSDDFLKYNLPELLDLATRGNTTQKKWLRTYLKECDNSSEKRQLLAALRN